MYMMFVFWCGNVEINITHSQYIELLAMEKLCLIFINIKDALFWLGFTFSSTVSQMYEYLFQIDYYDHI